jgi:MFS superfamily sulfate permease-like transporter
MKSVHLTIKEKLRNDVPASIVVFLVALPLCLGISIASGASPFAGIVAGIVGGIIVGLLSGSSLAVSGPAAGLTVIVFSAIEQLGSFEIFLAAVVCAGILQILMGMINAGVIGHFFPFSVIKGMLAAIGLILILKQIPHLIGYDQDALGSLFFRQSDGRNTFSEIFYALFDVQTGALIVGVLSIFILFIWEIPALKRNAFFKIFPGSLCVVIFGVIINEVFFKNSDALFIQGSHRVTLHVAANIDDFFSQFSIPDFGSITNLKFVIITITLALVASLESLLSLDATDKLDPYRRVASTNRELIAQGIGNLISGSIGGLPITAVIVRSSANINAGAKSRLSAIIHGLLLLLTVITIPQWLNRIPLASLAAILIMVGYKLTRPALFRESYEKGKTQFVPFIVTILAILFTDLLTGIGIGILVGILFVFISNFHLAIFVSRDEDKYLVKLTKDVSFLNKAYLRRVLRAIPEGSSVIIDGSRSQFIDHDIIETIQDFLETAPLKGITVEIKKTNSSSNSFFRKELP